MDIATRDWSEGVFGAAVCGDRRRLDRLVRVAAEVAACPRGTVTGVIRGSAAREGAFRLLANRLVLASAIADAVFNATLRSCASEPWVFVALDGSSLSLTDRVGGREVGGVGAWSSHGRGLQVATALAVSPDGSPLGLCGQRWWAREKPSSRLRRGRHAMQTETRHGVELLEEVHARFRDQAPTTMPWFQLDRGYDVWPVLLSAAKRDICITVRASHNRCVRAHRYAKPKYLFMLAQRAPLLGSYSLEIPATAKRAARTAVMDVRSRQVTLELRVSGKRREYVAMTVVFVKERARHEPLTWILLTNVPVFSLTDALRVVEGYTTRWRIEEFHRAWKRGGCNVEDTQLRGRDSIIKWATILGAVAARATRLTYLAREKPDVPATDELSRDEIDATIALLRPKGIKLGASPTLRVAVGWIADVGGFAGQYSGRPPGPTVIARGLERVEILARGMENLRHMR
jgi:hypothetical protein